MRTRKNTHHCPKCERSYRSKKAMLAHVRKRHGPDALPDYARLPGEVAALRRQVIALADKLRIERARHDREQARLIRANLRLVLEIRMLTGKEPAKAQIRRRHRLDFHKELDRLMPSE